MSSLNPNLYVFNNTYVVYADSKQLAKKAFREFARTHKNGENVINVDNVTFKDCGSVGFAIMNPANTIVQFAKIADECVSYYPNQSYAYVSFHSVFHKDENKDINQYSHERVRLNKKVEKVLNIKEYKYVECEIYYFTYEYSLEIFEPEKSKTTSEFDIPCVDPWGKFDLYEFAKEYIPNNK